MKSSLSHTLLRNNLTVLLCLYFLRGLAQEKYDVSKDPEVVAAINKAMNNPVSELFILQSQIDFTQIAFPQPQQLHIDKGTVTITPGKSVAKWQARYSFIPTFPVPISKKWNLVSRIAIPFVNLPLNEEFGNVISSTPGGILADSTLSATAQNPYGQTKGMGDLIYVGLFAPKESVTTGSGSTIFYGFGPTVMMPTASKEILGTGTWAAGPAAVFGHMGKNWRVMAIAQQYWGFNKSYTGKEINFLTAQYGIFYMPDPLWSIGMSPTITMNWAAPPNEALTFPVGFGFNHTIYLGPLPVLIGAEAQYAVGHPETYPSSRTNFRIYIVPVIPAPWSNLGKTIKAKMAKH